MITTLAMVLAGGQGSRLSVLSSKRAKPAIPFGGFYRLIDFTLSNIINSGIDNTGILTQYRSRSLIDHIQTGEAWGFYGRNRNVTILPPYTGKTESSWYKGTADAILQNLSYINKFKDIKRILILSGDHIYNMDFNKIIKFHKKKKAKLTIVAKEVSIVDAKRFGTVVVDSEDKLLHFEEKPDNPKNNLISLGIYVFDKDILIDTLLQDANINDSSRDFARDIVHHINKKDIYVYKFNGYWKDVGTIQSYYETNMELLSNIKEFNLNNWHLRSNQNRRVIEDRNPAYIGQNATVFNSLISDGCLIEGTVKNSILSPGVHIKANSIIENSIVFHDVCVENNTIINSCIIDKEVNIGANSFLGYNNTDSKTNFVGLGITIVGKGANIPENIKIGKSCVIYPLINKSDFKKNKYNNGEVIK